MAYVAVRMQFNEEKRDVALLVEYAVQLQHTRHATNERNYHANRIHTHVFKQCKPCCSACLHAPEAKPAAAGWWMEHASCIARAVMPVTLFLRLCFFAGADTTHRSYLVRCRVGQKHQVHDRSELFVNLATCYSRS